MRKIIIILVSLIICIMPISYTEAYASEASVVIKVTGQIKKGDNIEILVEVKDVKNMYAASVNFTYDKSQLKVNSIKGTDFITKNSNDIMELGGEVDKNGDTATYSFTFLGDKQGVSGSNTFVKIEATVLDDKPLVINSDNMEVKLVQRSGEDVVNYPFTFLGFKSNEKNKPITDSNSSSQPNGADKETSNNNSDDGISNKNDSNISNNNSFSNPNDNSDKDGNLEALNEEKSDEEIENINDKTTSTITNENLNEENKNIKVDNNVTMLNKKTISTTNKLTIIIVIFIVVAISSIIGYFICKNKNIS